jgi:hypothetical protein
MLSILFYLRISRKRQQQHSQTIEDTTDNALQQSIFDWGHGDNRREVFTLLLLLAGFDYYFIIGTEI